MESAQVDLVNSIEAVHGHGSSVAGDTTIELVPLADSKQYTFAEPLFFQPKRPAQFPAAYQPFFNGVANMFKNAGLAEGTSLVPQFIMSKEIPTSVVNKTGPCELPQQQRIRNLNERATQVPSHSERPSASGYHSDLLAPRPPDSATVPVSVSHRPRHCGGINCLGVLPGNYPHLRCRRCRAHNNPRRPEVKGIFTGAQMTQHFPHIRLQQQYHTPTPPPTRLQGSGPALHSPIPPPTKLCAPTSSQNVATSFQIPHIDLVPKQEIHVSEVPPSSLNLEALLGERPVEVKKEEDMNDEIPDIDNLELAYPDSETNVTMKDTEALTNVPFPPPHPKRRKVSHPMGPPRGPPIPTRPTSSGLSHTPMVPTSVMSQLTGRQLSPCSTHGCSNPVENATPSTKARCSDCIVRDWKSKKARSKSMIRPPKNSMRVTWADELETKKVQPKLQVPSFSQRSPIEDEMDVDDDETVAGWNSESAANSCESSEESQSSDERGGELASDSECSDEDIPLTLVKQGKTAKLQSYDEEGEVPLAVTTQRPILKIRIPARPRGIGFTPKPKTSEDSVPLPPSSSEPPASSSVPSSALTDLNNVTTEPPLYTDEFIATALQNGGRWCANATKCKQLLEPGYTWKSCVLCRARTREYQRKRQNLQAVHQRLEEELERYKEKLGLGGSTRPGQEVGLRALKRSISASPATLTPSTASPITQLGRRDSSERPLLPSSQLVPGARLCTVKQCPRVLPSVEEFKWKTCTRCRRRFKLSRLRREGALPDDDGHDTIGADDHPEDPIVILVSLDKRSDGRCPHEDCGVLVEPGSSFAYCRPCRLLALRAIKRGMKKMGKSDEEIYALLNGLLEVCPKRNTTTPTGENGSSSTSKPSLKIPSLKKRQLSNLMIRPPTPYPDYKCLDALTDNLKKLSKDFFEAQILRYACKAPVLPSGAPSPLDDSPLASPVDGLPATASFFCFDGEFSTVATDFNIVSRKPAVDAKVGRIKNEFKDAVRLRIAFPVADTRCRPRYFVSLFDYGIITRFACARECRLLCPAPQAVGDEKANMAPASGPRQEIVKIMEGELEVAVLVDRSHPYIPGERTVVRLRLVG
ncbi:hypothetical protein FA15DRAFT_674260 [Coprinopsis marcescibilis]|uniref:Uncharacterized protein n=1 Tax=Coprinopsis marcescibilis TaxID=230819 RepID=A0A5C3KID8_COPMA|nr:hypothetical protein FA15DRAFT_674260 [Coprinopsis marcescibilis]